MYKLLFSQFLRTKTCQIGLVLILILGGISLMTGKQFLMDQRKVADQVVEKQLEHIGRNLELHGDDLPLLMYYLKFTLVNATNPLAGLSIGQRDLNPSVQRVTILTLEGQKYDTDLVNPTKLLYGNLDLSFVIIYIFPLLVIAFTYNLLSEEEESGTWTIVSVMAKSKRSFLLKKLSVRLILLVVVMLISCGLGAVTLAISPDGAFLLFVTSGLLYLVFWFSLCFLVICLKQNSNFNALLLLSVWLVLVILLPAFVNNYVITQYPIPEAMTTMIKQRDGYHEKWDTNKKETLEEFYKDYPQFSDYGFPPEQGFNWMWYYAMQHLGDVESREASKAMELKIRLREQTSQRWAKIIPSMHAQLLFNNLAGTGLLDYLSFLRHTNEFHEDTRLYFYPKIFSNKSSDSVEWDRFKPKYFQFDSKEDWLTALTPFILSILLFAGVSFFLIRRV